jgi:hypothetical protein
VGADVIVASGSIKVGANTTFGTKTTSEQEITYEPTETFRIPGQSDFVNHDWDQIWFLVKPAIHVKVQERPGPPYPVATEVSWQYVDGQQATTFWVYAGELLGHLAMPQEVQNQLLAWGFAEEDRLTLLAADPLVWPTNVRTVDANGTPIELMLPAGSMLPQRFELVEVLPYRPLGSPTEQPTVLTYSVKKVQTDSFAAEVSQSYSVSTEYSAGFNFIAKAHWKFADKFTYSLATTAKLSEKQTNTDALTLGQPSFGYAGPVLVYVYEDKLWHTYAFRLE